LERYIQQLLVQFPEDLNYVVKHFPLSSHQFSQPGSMAALAAGKQGKFWEFHGLLLENHNQLSEEKILEIAKELALNMDQFEKDRQNASSRQLIAEDLANGRKIGVRGTPAVFLNGKRVNNKDLGKLPKLIRKELGK
jgi:protein-disulfide isomerase